MTVSQVKFCSFTDFTQTPLAIRQTNDCEVLFSLFSHCSSEDLSGCIFAKCRNLNLSHNCCEYSFSMTGFNAVYTEDANVCFNSSSVTFCDVEKRVDSDVLYFLRENLKSSNCNVSSCCCTQSVGIQGTDVNSFNVSFFHGADGDGFASIELSIPSNIALFDKIALVNNTINDMRGVVYVKDTAQFTDGVFSGNTGKGFYGGNFILKNCFYYSKFPTGLNSDSPGLTILKKPTMSWLTVSFETKFCVFRNIETKTIDNKSKTINIALMLLVLALQKLNKLEH